MKGIAKMRLISVVFTAFGAIGLTACGGTSSDSQVAAAVQTLLAKTMETYMTAGANSSSSTQRCGADSSSGTITLSGGTFNPSSPGSLSNVTATYVNCIIDVCGSTQILNGAVNGITVKTIGTTQFSLTMSVSSSLTFSGIISAPSNFGYTITGTGTTSELQNVNISDVIPLNYLGRSYNAADIGPLANGC